MSDYNWGAGLSGGLSGAASGASIGSMFGPWGTAIGGGVGAIGGLLGGFEEEQGAQSRQINPFSQRYWDMATQNMNNFEQQMGSALDTQGNVLGEARNIGQQMASFSPDYQFDPGAALRMTSAQMPQLQDIAQESMSQYGMDSETVQNQMQNAAQRTAGQFQQMNGLGSGAAAQAIGQAGAEVAGQLNQQNQQRYQQSLMDLLNRNYQGNLQGLQQRLQAEQQADQMRMQGLQAGGQQILNVGQQYGQQAGIYGDLFGQTQNSLASMARPEMIYQPPQQTRPFGDLSTGMTQAAGIGMQAQDLGLFDNILGGGGTMDPVNQFRADNPQMFTPSSYYSQMG